jgi:hypothetical protein
MFTQLLVTIVNGITSRVVSTYNNFSDLKFYFTVIMAAFLALAYVYKDTIDLTLRNHAYSLTEFRECRNISGLEKDLSSLLVSNPNVVRYGVYLYEPKNQSFYKKLVLTNSEIAKNSPSLQSIYLKDQPSINEVFKTNPYYLVDRVDMEKPDLKYLADISTGCVLFYKLTVNGVTVGEINLRFINKPTPAELEDTIRKLSPLMYLYII